MRNTHLHRATATVVKSRPGDWRRAGAMSPCGGMAVAWLRVRGHSRERGARHGGEKRRGRGLEGPRARGKGQRPKATEKGQRRRRQKGDTRARAQHRRQGKHGTKGARTREGRGSSSRGAGGRERGSERGTGREGRGRGGEPQAHRHPTPGPFLNSVDTLLKNRNRTGRKVMCKVPQDNAEMLAPPRQGGSRARREGGMNRMIHGLKGRALDRIPLSGHGAV